jgi:hypothetical protein
VNISASELRRAADIQDRIESLRGELDNLLGGNVQTSGSQTSKRKRRKMSAAARARIAAAARARWAKFRAGKK